jgi:hypothetical protein
VGRQRDQFENDFGKYPQGALGPHHQSGEVIPGGAFDGAGPRFDQVALHVEKAHAHHVVAGHAVFQPTQPAGIFSHVAADGGDRLAAGIGRIEKPFGFHGGSQSGRDHAGLDHGVHVRLVDLEDGFHPVGHDHHTTGQGHRAAAEIGAGAPYGER